MKSSFFARPAAAAVTASFCCILWGSAGPFIKWGYAALGLHSSGLNSVLLFAGIRFTLAGLMLLPLFIKQVPPANQAWQFSKAVLILSMVQTFIQYFFYYAGLVQASGVSAAIITGTGAFFACLTAVYCFHLEKMTALKLAGCLIGFAGAMIMALQGSIGSIGFALGGEGFIFLSQISSAVSASCIQIYSRKWNAGILSSLQFILGGLLLSLTGLLTGGWIQFNIRGLMILFYLAFVSAAAYTLWGFLLASSPVSKIVMYELLIPVSGIFWSALLLHENAQAFSPTTLISLILVILGIVMVNKVGSDGRQRQS